jgi:hypothetical protein
MKKVIALLSMLIVSLFAGMTASAIFDISPLLPAAGSFAISVFVPDMPGIAALRVFTAPGGAGVPFAFNMTYLPQFLIFNDGGNPLTSLRIESQEDGIIQDYVTAALPAVNGYMVPGAQPANTIVLPVATGEIRGRNVTISGVTSAAGAIAIFADSDNKGFNGKPVVPFKLNNAQILALNPTRFEDFTALFVPTMAAGDTAEVIYRDGHKQTFEAAELLALSAKYQQVAGIIVNNINAYIKSVEFQCAAATPAYMLSVKTSMK